MPHAILSVLFGRVDQLVGLLDQSIERGQRPVDGHRPDAEGRGPAAAHGPAKRGHELFQDQFRGLVDSLGQEQDEFIAAIAGDDIEGAQVALQRLRDLHQQPVAVVVAALVVDLLEVVDIQIGERKRPLVALGAGEFERGRLDKSSSVEKTRQRIGPRQCRPVLSRRSQPGQNEGDHHEEAEFDNPIPIGRE